MEQLERVKLQLHISCRDEDDLIKEFLEQAKFDILNRRYPFGIPLKDDGTTIDLENRYLSLQVELAIIKYNMQGVEGQSEHSENGIKRVYSNRLLSAVVPLCKSI